MNILKKKVFLIGIAICIVLVGSILIYNSKNNSTNSEPESKVVSESESLVQFESVNDLIKYSDNVVLGKVIEDNEFSKTTREYTFTVENSLKGSVNSLKIKVYETNGTLNLGNKYILFLESSQSEYFPDTSYTSVDKDAIIKVDEKELFCKKSGLVEDSKNINAFIQKIKTSPYISYIREKSTDRELVASTEDDLYTKSDYVFHVIPKEVIYENKYIKSVKVEIVKSYKGEFVGNSEILLPADIMLEQEYIVFLKKQGTTMILTAKNKSVISKGDTNWDSFINKYEK
jgi:hypothetical protein